jgi:hypothetical protein
MIASVVLKIQTKRNGLAGPSQLTREKLMIRIMTPNNSIHLMCNRTKSFMICAPIAIHTANQGSEPNSNQVDRAGNHLMPGGSTDCRRLDGDPTDQFAQHCWLPQPPGEVLASQCNQQHNRQLQKKLQGLVLVHPPPTDSVQVNDRP